MSVRDRILTMVWAHRLNYDEAARLFQVRADTVRKWDSEGKTPTTDNKYRLLFLERMARDVPALFAGHVEMSRDYYVEHLARMRAREREEQRERRREEDDDSWRLLLGLE